MSGSTIYVLTEKIRSNLRCRGYGLRCRKCGEPLQVGDLIISKYNCSGRRKYYHHECWKNLFV